MNLTNEYHYKKGLNGKDWQELFDKVRLLGKVKDIRKVTLTLEYQEVEPEEIKREIYWG